MGRSLHQEMVNSMLFESQWEVTRKSTDKVHLTKFQNNYEHLTKGDFDTTVHFYREWPVTGSNFSQICDSDCNFLPVFGVTFLDLWSVASVTCDFEEIWFSQVACDWLIDWNCTVLYILHFFAMCSLSILLHIPCLHGWHLHVYWTIPMSTQRLWSNEDTDRNLLRVS